MDAHGNPWTLMDKGELLSMDVHERPWMSTVVHK